MSIVGVSGLPVWIEIHTKCPPGWWPVERREDGVKFIHPDKRLCCIVSGQVEGDGKRWIHLSLSHEKRIPSWDQLVEAKEQFIGQELKAIQVLPPRSAWVNICDRVLHLWHCVDADPLPDFTGGTGSL